VELQMTLDLTDIQGLIHHSYRYPRSRHLLFTITSPSAGKKILKFLIPRITHAAQNLNPKPEWLLNVGISYSGLEALGLKPEILQQFPTDFREIPDPERMGDVGESIPMNWWNGKFLTPQIHLAVHLFGTTIDNLDNITEEVRQAALDNQELRPTKDDKSIDAGAISSIEGELHFGYRDGISKPDVRWGDEPGIPGNIDFRHFLLGYATNDIPSNPREFSANSNSKEAALFVRNGSYSVFRWLYQDVALFNRFLLKEGTRLYPNISSNEAKELLAAKLLGRWRDGTPLVLSPDRSNPELSNRNDFVYSTDEDGLRCPFSAHIRVTNPRDQLLDEDVGKVPHVIRRGAPFGPKLEGMQDDGIDRGLVGMFICANLKNQFYKLTSWMKENNFSPKFKNLHAQDPFGNRLVPDASNEFSILTEEEPLTVNLQNFVITKGTVFFLLPSLKALNYLAYTD